MTDVINDVEVVTAARKAAKLVMSDLNDRSGLGFSSVDDDTVREIEDTLTEIIDNAVGEGPFTLDATADLNRIYATVEPTEQPCFERRVANGLYTIVAHEFGLPNDPEKELRLTDALFHMTQHIRNAVGHGDVTSPFTMEVAQNLNRIHAAAIEQNAGYSVSYQPTVKEFTVQSLGQKLEHHVSTTDTLWAAVQQAREKLEKK